MKLKQLLIKGLLLIALFLAISCSQAGGSFNKMESAEVYYDEDQTLSFELQDTESVAEFSADSKSDDLLSNMQDEPQQRKRIYNGNASLVVEEVEQSKKDIEKLAVDIGGYVTNIYNESIIIKVPAENFHMIFDAILHLGDVTSHNISTYDVTDYYADTSARLLTAEKTRERLQVLLAQSTNPEERSRILREIGRLTEEIELIKNRLQTLDRNIAFSTISVILRPRLEQNMSQQTIPFEWIANLYPLGSASYRLRANLQLEPGEDFAIFSKSRIYHAENSNETTIKVSTVENHPIGDETFWQQALVHHMGDYYKETVRKDLTIGDNQLLGVEFISKDRDPYRYFVGVVSDGNKLHVFEIFTPDSSVYFNSLYSALAEGDI